MVDITVFRMEIDDSTFNAPFGGRAQSDGKSPATDADDSGPSIKLIAGLGGVLVLTLLVFVVLLKRRFGGSDEESTDEATEYAIDTSDPDEDKKESQERDGLRAMIGLSFLVAMTVLINRWNEPTRKTTDTRHSR